MLDLARAAAVLVATLTLSGSTAADTLRGVEVRRVCLFGYEVGGTIWEEQDAARALAYEAGKAYQDADGAGKAHSPPVIANAVSVASAPAVCTHSIQPTLPGLDVAATVAPVVSAQLHHDLLRGPVESLGAWAEIWFAGDAANRRIAALKSALGWRNVSEAVMPPQGFTVEDAKTRIRYTVPRGASVPAIEAA